MYLDRGTNTLFIESFGVYAKYSDKKCDLLFNKNSGESCDIDFKTEKEAQEAYNYVKKQIGEVDILSVEEIREVVES